ncbi:MAG: SLC13 family permease, partial [Aestuariivirga sp.]|nr:SLC13 family permease [Aestuariivirga sp.]
MTPDIALCLAILIAAVALFAWDRIAADVVALGVLLAVVSTKLISTELAFAGFGSGTVVMILGLFIMTAALSNTGIVDIVGRYVLSHVGTNPAVLIAVVMISVSALSAFISNTAATAFFIPIVLGIAGKRGTSPSRYLLPLAFASILTSSVSLVSTSTNIVISELMSRSGQPAMGMFEIAPVGIPIAVAGIIYMLTIGVRLMPHREKDGPSIEDVGNRTYQADLVIPDGSSLIGKTIAESPIAANSGYAIVKLLRGSKPLDSNAAKTVLAAGDDIVIAGTRRDLLRVKDINGIEIKADVHLADPDLRPEDAVVVEGVLMPGSPLIGQSLRSAEFHDRYGLQVLGLNRAGYGLAHKLSRIRMRLGDVLLLQGSA